MSLTYPLRARVEEIACDGYGASQTIVAGRFTRATTDWHDAHPVDSTERRVDVNCDPPRAPDGVVNNPLDLFALYAIPFVVRVYYLRTNAGGDMAEGATEQHGSGELDAIRDRAGTDAHDLLTALTYFENWSGLDPFLIDIGPDGAPEIDEEGQRVVLSVPFVATVRATRPGSYAP